MAAQHQNHIVEIEAIRRQGFKFDKRPPQSVTLRLACLEEMVKRTSQAQMDSCYVLESLNHLVFGQLQASILSGPLQQAMGGGSPGKSTNIGESQMFLSEEERQAKQAERGGEQAKLQRQIEDTLDQFLSENK